MEASIEARVSAETVWQAWEKAHALHANDSIVPGKRAKSSGFKYQILDVLPGERFSILWKTLFVRMIFTHSIQVTQNGIKICYAAEIKGLFAWPVRWMLRNKIQKNLSFVLKEFVKQLK